MHIYLCIFMRKTSPHYTGVSCDVVFSRGYIIQLFHGNAKRSCHTGYYAMREKKKPRNEKRKEPRLTIKREQTSPDLSLQGPIGLDIKINTTLGHRPFLFKP